MESFEIFERLGLAIAIGAVVGVERHWRGRDEPSGQRTAGLRTFALVGMLGGAAGFIAQALNANGSAAGLVVVGFFGAFAAVFALFQYRESVADKTYSVTSVVAAMVTFALGVIAVLGDINLASAGGVALVAILASREILHNFMRKLTWSELQSAILLMAMTFVVLPLVPSEPIGPFGGISPSKTWLLVIVLATISFCGYIAVKLLGSARGELVAGAVGGVISSTAATVSNARRAAAGGEPGILAAGALGASAVSYIRTALLVWLLAAPLAGDLIAPLLVAALVMVACAVALTRADGVTHEPQQPKNPFDLDSVVKMAVLLTAVGFLARAAAAWFGGTGVLVVSALSGLADVDAVTVTVSGMLGTLPLGTASLAIGIAVVSNTLAKAAYALALGKAPFGLRVGVASLVSLAAGAAALVFTM